MCQCGDGIKRGKGEVQLKTLSLVSHVVSVLSDSVWFPSALLPACALHLTFFSLLTLFIIHPSVIISHACVVFFFLLLHVISPLLVCSAGGCFCLVGWTLVPNQPRFPADLHPSLVSGDEFRVSLLTQVRALSLPTAIQRVGANLNRIDSVKQHENLTSVHNPPSLF